MSETLPVIRNVTPEGRAAATPERIAGPFCSFCAESD